MSFDKVQIQQDVRAIEHAKTEDTAKEAALLLRNDLCRMRNARDRKQALDFVHRTNVYDRSENPNLPKIILISHPEYSQYKVATDLIYKDGKKIHEGSPD